MKRLLAWVALWASEFVVALILSVIGFIFAFVFDCMDSVGAIGKVIIVVISGSFLLGCLITPYTIAFPLISALIEAIHQSQTGLRYMVFGWVTTITYGMQILLSFTNIIHASNMILFIYGRLVYMSLGIYMIYTGKSIKAGIEEKKRAEIEEAAIERYKTQNQ